jgi:RimJ/RimL family protein N-acetyltransferase
MGAAHPLGRVSLASSGGGFIADLTPDDVRHITHRLRAWDRREVFALMPFEATPDHVAAVVLAPALVELRRCVRAPDGEPVAMLGLTSFWPGCFQAWLLATDRWREVWRLGVRAARDVIAEGDALGMRRAECRSMAGHDDAHALLRWLGFAPEGQHPAMGREGETFITFARVV